MKTCAILMDCHGEQIMNYLYSNDIFKNNFNINFISINNYVIKNRMFYNNTELDHKHIKILKNADVLIIQVIEKDRGFLNNSEIIKFCKSDCIVIKIPHYRNSIYQYKCIENKTDKYDLLKSWKLPTKIKDINNIDDTKKVIQNEINIMNNFPYDEDELLDSMNNKIKEFEKIDNLSDIKMLDYYNNNFKKYRMFQGRGYPASRFFFELTNRILNKLNYSPNKNFIDTYFAQNTGEPIPTYWYKYCKFSFDNKYYTYGNIYITECEWYYIILLSNNLNIGNKNENINYLKIIRKL